MKLTWFLSKFFRKSHRGHWWRNLPFLFQKKSPSVATDNCLNRLCNQHRYVLQFTLMNISHLNTVIMLCFKLYVGFRKDISNLIKIIWELRFISRKRANSFMSKVNNMSDGRSRTLLKLCCKLFQNTDITSWHSSTAPTNYSGTKMHPHNSIFPVYVCLFGIRHDKFNKWINVDHRLNFANIHGKDRTA